MVVQPHDLLKIDNPGFVNIESIPKWVHTSLKLAPYVVVRRAPIIQGKIPVGVRGSKRSQRFGTYIKQDEILNHIPYMKVLKDTNWRLIARKHSMPAVRALSQVNEILQPFFPKWGPGGSVGFELVSGTSTVNEASDLDVIVYSEVQITEEDARGIINSLKEIPVHVDVQVDTGDGSFSLQEFAKRENRRLMFKTLQGPYLVENPWQPDLEKWMIEVE